jgi:oligopeptide transport system ATP-binding protein
MYSGSFIEKGSKKDIFLNPLHPYTWALIASIPQFSEKNTSLFSLEGSPFPPEMDIKFDSFAPRNNYALKVDFFYSAPMFQISPTHFVKSWLYSPNATPIQPPENVLNAIECLKEVIK